MNATLENVKTLMANRQSAGTYYTLMNVTVSGRYLLSVQTAGQVRECHH